MSRPNNKKGFTIVELVITITILGILATTTGGIIISLMQMVVYLPREVKARMVAQEALNTLIEGDSNVRGMRSAREIISAEDDSLTYRIGYPTDAEKMDIQIEWDSANKKLRCRHTDLGDAGSGDYSSWETVPYYATAEISIIKNGSTSVFTYYKSDETAWTPSGSSPTNLYEIRRVDIEFRVTTGTGLFQNWDASFVARSGIDLKDYSGIL